MGLLVVRIHKVYVDTQRTESFSKDVAGILVVFDEFLILLVLFLFTKDAIKELFLFVPLLERNFSSERCRYSLFYFLAVANLGINKQPCNKN